MIVADTDVLIDFLQNRNPGADRIAFELEKGDLATTAITRFELLSGARGARQERNVRQLLDVLLSLPLDEAAADLGAGVRLKLQKAGQEIGMADSLIAGIVLARNAILLTRNRKHFERIEGLHVSLTGA
ncbi:MAG: type II toxin-antitoxin system VapC family toxin [Acidobacteriota bacterium]